MEILIRPKGGANLRLLDYQSKSPDHRDRGREEKTEALVLEERSSLWERAWVRIFGAGSRRPARIEKVIAYVTYRLNEGARLDEIIQEEYVRRQTSAQEIEQVIADPRIVGTARGRMHREFGSEEMSPKEQPRRDPG